MPTTYDDELDTALCLFGTYPLQQRILRLDGEQASNKGMDIAVSETMRIERYKGTATSRCYGK